MASPSIARVTWAPVGAHCDWAEATEAAASSANAHSVTNRRRGATVEPVSLSATAAAMMTKGAWLTPLGAVPIDCPLAQALSQSCHLLAEDAQAHQDEHSLEVQLPFLQCLVKEFSFVPVSIGLGGYAALESLGRAVAETVNRAGKPVLIVASSDMNHYEPDDVTRAKDRKAVDQILALHPQGLYDVIRREGISMCGYGPVVAMLVAAKELGAQRAELVKYATSADVSGDRSAVVGYAGIVVT